MLDISYPKEKRVRLVERIETHFTPLHGSWLNITETELSALKDQGLDRRTPDMTTVQTEVGTWEQLESVSNYSSCDRLFKERCTISCS